MNQDIPETYEELKLAFIAECKERYENNETSRKLLEEQGSEIANLEREKEELHQAADSLESEVECLEKCSLSQEFMEETGVDTIEEFEKDCRDNWKKLDRLQGVLERLASAIYEGAGKQVPAFRWDDVEN